MPNGDGPPREPTTAVTVVGLGGAGCRMLRTVADLADRVDPDPAVEYVAMDTDRGDLTDLAPADAEQVHLEFPETDAEIDRPDYLNGLLLPMSSGTARRRPLGRYAVDNPANFEAVYERLAGTLRTVHERETANGAEGAHQVWLLSSLGGGTGGGALPLVVAMVDDVLTGLRGETPLGVLGSLPRLDALEGRATAPAGSGELYINAYTALRELAVLLGADDEVAFPVSITAPSTFDSDLMAADGFEMAGPPIDACGLLAVREAAPQTYRDVANATAASVVLGFASQAVSVTPEHDDRTHWSGVLDERLFSVDGTEATVPVEDLQRLATVSRNRDEADETADQLREEATMLADAIDYVRDALGHDPLADEASPLSGVDDPIASLADRLESGVSEREVEVTIERVAADLDPPDVIDPDPVAEYLVVDAIEGRLTDAVREGHRFPTALEEVVEQYRDVLDLPADLSGSSVTEEWESMVRPTLQNRYESLADRRESTTFVRVLENSRIESELETLEARLEELDALYEEYRSRVGIREDVATRRRRSRERLRDRRRELEDRLEEVRERRIDVLDERSHLAHRAESIAGRLRSPDDSPYRIQVPVADPSEAAKRVEETSPADLEEVVRARIVDEAAFRETATTALSALREPVQDRRRRGVGDDGTPGNLFVFGPGDPDEFVDIDGSIRVFGREQLDPFSLRFTGLFAPIDLHETSEFGTFHEIFSDPSRDVSSQFGDVTDWQVTGSFAYPELLPADTVPHAE